MKKSPRPLQLEILEDRTVPTAFGVPWADPTHLTLSFVPDGTSVPGGGTSSLFQTMYAVAPTATWKGEIVKAFQAWAVNANINIGVVADSGDPIGTAGAVQGDTRFGDIRIAAAPLALGDVALAAPFSWTGTTLSGDVVLNTNYPFGIGNIAGKYDLDTVMMHEAGHVFGLDHNPTDPTSVMQETYTYRTALDAQDVQHLQALYAARVAEPAANNSFATATDLGNAQPRATTTGEIGTISDIDYFKVSTSGNGVITVSFRVKASGLSLLTPSITVYSDTQTQLGMMATTDPLNNDVVVTLANVKAGSKFYVRVGSTRSDAFGVGAYRLTVDSLANGATPPPNAATSTTTVINSTANTTLDKATKIDSNKQGLDARFDVALQSALTTTAPTNFFRMDAPPQMKGVTGLNLDVMVWALDPNGLNPAIHLFDQNGKPLPFQVLSNDAGLMSIQIANITNVQTLYVQVSARDATDTAHNRGNYFLGVDLNTLPPVIFTGVASNNLTNALPQDNATLAVSRPALMQFALSADAGSSGSAAGVTMTITDSTGKVVVVLSAQSGKPMVTKAVFLNSGSYTVTYSVSGLTGTQAVTYNMFSNNLSDGIGPLATSASTGGTTSSSGGYVYTGSSMVHATTALYWF